MDRTRREALNRAKREPFVIYMMSVLSDISLKRAGFDPELRDRISAAWRAEDYTLAGNLIPDELLDAYMLCGTREDVAAKALAFTVETGLELPLLQPVLQEERQVEELIAAAALYAELPASARWVAPAAGDEDIPGIVATTAGAASRRLPARSPTTAGSGRWRPSGAGSGRRGRSSGRSPTRPPSSRSSPVPRSPRVDGLFEAAPFLAALAGAVLLHSGTNIVNEIYDVRQGIDTIVSPRASHAIVKGRMTERAAFTVAGLAFLLAIAVGVYLLAYRGPAIAVLGILGLVGGWGYTAPPLQYKYRALGVPLVFLLMGPLMVVGQLLRGHRPVEPRRADPVRAGRPARRGDPPRQRVARHQRGHPGRDRHAVVARSGAIGPTTGTSGSSSAPTSRSGSRSPSRCCRRRPSSRSSRSPSSPRSSGRPSSAPRARPGRSR